MAGSGLHLLTRHHGRGRRERPLPRGQVTDLHAPVALGPGLRPLNHTLLARFFLGGRFVQAAIFAHIANAVRRLPRDLDVFGAAAGTSILKKDCSCLCSDQKWPLPGRKARAAEPQVGPGLGHPSAGSRAPKGPGATTAPRPAVLGAAQATSRPGREARGTSARGNAALRVYQR